MKIPSSLIIVFVFALITIGLGWRVSYLQSRLEFVSDERNQAVQFATNQKEATSHYINKYNQEVAKVKQSEISQDNLKRLLETRELSHLKNFESINKRLSNIENFKTISMSVRGDSIRLVPVFLKDSLRAFRWEIKDEYNDISATVLDSPKFKMDIPLHAVAIWQRKKFLGLRIGKKAWVTEAFTPNKMVHIDSITSFSVIKRKK